MVRLYAIIILLITALPSQGQGLPGYVVLPAGDTLRGYIVESTGHRITFHQSQLRQPRFFRPSEVREYGLEKNVPFISRSVHMASGHDSLRFVRATLIGPATLYEATPSQREFYLQPPASNQLYELTTITWHLLYARHLTGCSTVDFTDPQILGVKFERQGIENLLSRYNRCVAPDWERRATNSANHRRQLVVRADLALSVATEQGNSAQIRPSGGLSIEFRQVNSSGWWLAAGVEALQLRGGPKPYLVYTGTTLYTRTRTSTYALNSLSVAGTLGRNLGAPTGIRPYAYVGVAGGLLFNSHYDTRLEYSNDFYPSTFTRDNYSQEFLLQGRLGVGAWVPISPRHDLQLAVQYGQLIPARVVAFRVHILSLQAGYIVNFR